MTSPGTQAGPGPLDTELRSQDSQAVLSLSARRPRPAELNKTLITTPAEEIDNAMISPLAGTHGKTPQATTHSPPRLQHQRSYLPSDSELHMAPDTSLHSPMRSPHHRRSVYKIVTPSQRRDANSPNTTNRQSAATSRLFEILEKGEDLDDTEISGLIGKYRFFNEFSLHSAVSLAKLCSCRRLKRGEILFRQEDVDDDSLYLILEGSISLRTSGNKDPGVPIPRQETGADKGLDSPILPPHLHRQFSKEVFDGRSGNAGPGTLSHSNSFEGNGSMFSPLSKDRGSFHDGHRNGMPSPMSRDKSFNAASFDALYGPEVGMLGHGDVYGDRVFQDRMVQNTLHASTGVVNTPTACALRLCKKDVELAGLIEKVWSRVTYITRTDVFDGLRRRLAVAPEDRDADTINFILSSLEFMPFFMHLRDSGALPEIARYFKLEEIGAEQKLLWYEGSTTADEQRYTMHVILDGEVHHYIKGSSVNPLDIRALNWKDENNISRTLGTKKIVSKVGNVVGGPTQFGISTSDTVVAVPKTVLATIDRAAWKPALSSLNRSFSCRPQHLRRLLAAVMSSSEQKESLGVRRGQGAEDGERSVAQDLAQNLRDGIQFFEQVPFEKLAELCVRFKLIKVLKGDPLCIAGEPSSGVFVIFTGTADARAHPRFVDVQPPSAVEWSRMLAAQGDSSSQRFLESDMDPTPLFGPKIREVVPGSLVFSGNAEHTWSESLLAGETPLEAIFIETPTYIELISPSQTPDAAVSVASVIQAMATDACERSFEDRETIAQFLGTLPELRRMSPRMLQQLSSAVSLRTYDARDVICEQGQPADTWFGLYQGSISFHFKDSKSPEVPQTPGSNVVFKYGACFRVVFPGETFGQSSMLLNTDYLVTAVCREASQLFVIPKSLMDQELMEHVTASSRLLLHNSECLQKPVRQRNETEILSNVNYLRDNPFFSHLNDVALQKLAVSVQSLTFCPDEVVCNPSSDSGTRLMVVNRGTVSCFGPAKILKSLRLQPLQMRKHRTVEKRKSTEGLDEQDIMRLEGSTESGLLTFSRTESFDPSWRPESDEMMQSMDARGFLRSTSSAEDLSQEFASLTPFEDPSNSLSSSSHLPPSAFELGLQAAEAGLPASMRGMLNISAKLHMARSASRKHFQKQIVAAYGQAFWSSFMCSAEDDVEVLVLSKRKWKNLMAGASADTQEVISFLQAHPCFQRSKNTELATLLAQGRTINLEPNHILFREGDVLPDLYFLKKGSIELRTGIELSAGELSAGDRHFIPSVVVATLSTNAIVNQVIHGMAAVTPGEGAQLWCAHPEAFTAVATGRTSAIALSKAQVLQGSAEDRRERIEVLERLTRGFHPRRIAEIEKARSGMMHGSKVEPWHASLLRDRRDLRDVISTFQSKQFSKSQPPVFQPVKQSSILPAQDSTSTLAAVLSPRVDCLKLPRVVDRRTFVPTYSAEPPSTQHSSARRSLDRATAGHAGQPGRSLPPGGLRLLQDQVVAPQLARTGFAPRNLILRHGRPPKIASIHRPQPARHPGLLGQDSEAVNMHGQAVPTYPAPLSIQDLLRDTRTVSRQHPLKPYMRQ